MSSTAPERPRYSTGFRIFLIGIVVAVIGVGLVAVWAPLGVVLVVAGAVSAIWFIYPNDWRRTWPDDFPILSRLARTHAPSRFTTDVDEDSQRAWNALPARTRLVLSIVGELLGVAILVWVAADPSGVFFADPIPRVYFALVIAPLVLSVIFARLRKVWRHMRRD